MYFNVDPKIPVTYRYIDAFLTLWQISYKYDTDLLSEKLKIFFWCLFLNLKNLFASELVL